MTLEGNGRSVGPMRADRRQQRYHGRPQTGRGTISTPATAATKNVSNRQRGTSKHLSAGNQTGNGKQHQHFSRGDNQLASISQCRRRQPGPSAPSLTSIKKPATTPPASRQARGPGRIEQRLVWRSRRALRQPLSARPGCRTRSNSTQFGQVTIHRFAPEERYPATR